MIIQSSASKQRRNSTDFESQRKLHKASVSINITNAKYDVIGDCAKEKGWKLVYDDDADDNPPKKASITWIDVPELHEAFKTILPYQKINHFPGMPNIARKSRLAKNIKKMKKMFPKDYDFTPPTWILPTDYADFRQQFNQEGYSNSTFIVKPDASCQGRGIFLTQECDKINAKDTLVAQKYIRDPLLIGGKKFDLRVYVLITSCDPLRVYVFQDGLVRMCTSEYTPPNSDNMQKRYMHLTNYAINKLSQDFEQNTTAANSGSGSKRSIKWFLNWLEEREGKEKRDKLWSQISDIGLKALISIQPILKEEYEATFLTNATKPLVKSNEENAWNPSSICFQILGLDVLIDSNLKPWLLEVNHLPSFGCDSPLDLDIKSRLISQTFDLVKVSPEDEKLFLQYKSKLAKERLLGLSPSNDNQNIKEEVEEQTKDSEAANDPEDKLLDPDNLKAALISFYSRHNSEKNTNIDQIVHKYQDKQEQLNESLKIKYGEYLIPNLAKPETSLIEEDDQSLIDYVRVYPCSYAAPGVSNYDELLEGSKMQHEEQRMRLLAPLQQRRGGDMSKNHLPNIKSKDQQGRDCFGYLQTDRCTDEPVKKISNAIPTPAQIEAATRLMLGHSSTSKVPAPTCLDVIRNSPKDVSMMAKESVSYGRAYRQKLNVLQQKPTLSLSRISFGDIGINILSPTSESRNQIEFHPM